MDQNVQRGPLSTENMNPQSRVRNVGKKVYKEKPPTPIKRPSRKRGR